MCFGPTSTSLNSAANIAAWRYRHDYVRVYLLEINGLSLLGNYTDVEMCEISLFESFGFT